MYTQRSLWLYDFRVEAFFVDLGYERSDILHVKNYLIPKAKLSDMSKPQDMVLSTPLADMGGRLG